MTDVLHVYPPSAVRDLIESIQTSDAPPEEKITSLLNLQRDLKGLLGLTGEYLGTAQNERDAVTLTRRTAAQEARYNADIREELLRRRLASEDELDRLGYLSHRELDEAEENGTLEESLRGIADSFNAFGLALLHGPAFERMVRRSRTGQFADKPGAPKLGSTTTEKLASHAAGDIPHPLRGDVVPRAQAEGRIPDTPQVTDPDKRERYESRLKDLTARIDRTIRKGIKTDKKQNEAEKHFNTAGRTDQHRLLTFARDAASSPTTAEQYTDANGDYTPERRALHAQIIDLMLRQRREIVDPETGKKRYVLDANGDLLPEQAEPTVLFMGGGYSAGKSSVRKQLESEGRVPQDAVIIDPDQIKALLPEFAETLETDPEANLLVYEESWAIAQELQRIAQERGNNVIVDGITDTSAQEVYERVRSFTDPEHANRPGPAYVNPQVVYVDIPTDEAMRRAALRAQNATDPADRRFIPETIMRSVHRDVSATVPKLTNLAPQLGLTVEVWDNHQGKDENGKFRPPKRFLRVAPQEDTYDIEDTDLFDNFLSKATERIQGVDEGDSRAASLVRALRTRLDLRGEEPPARGPTADEQLGTFRDTRDKWSIVMPDGRRLWDPDRKAFHDEMVASYLRRRNRVEDENGNVSYELDPSGELLPSQLEGEKRALFTAGIPASGKSSAIGPEFEPPDAVLVDPDAVKEQLPEFQAMAEARDPYSGSGSHAESKEIAGRIEHEARQANMNLFIDGVGDREPGKFQGRIQGMLRDGYRTDVVVADIPKEVAKRRARLRAEETGRFVPDLVIDDYDANVPARHLEWRAMPEIGWEAYNTDVPKGEEPKLMARKDPGGEIVVVDPDLYAEFLNKAEWQRARQAEASPLTSPTLAPEPGTAG